MSEFFVVRTFNPMFFILLGLSALFCSLLILLFKNKSPEVKKILIICLYFATLIYLIKYKMNLVQDTEYSLIRQEAGLPGSNFWDELPFNLCNINTILIILAALTNSKILFSFTFYFGTLGALFGLLMPTTGFAGYSIFLPRVAGFYITHLMIFIQMPLLAGLKIYKPKFSDIIPTFVLLLLLTAIVTGFNFLLRTLDLSQTCNYFYSMDPSGNPVLGLLYNWIPIPGIYLLPCSLVALPCMVLITALFNISRKKNPA